MEGMQPRAGVKILLGAALVATMSVVAAHASEGLDFDKYTTYASNDDIEVEPQRMWAEEMPMYPSADVEFAQGKLSKASGGSVAHLKKELVREKKQEHEAAELRATYQRESTELDKSVTRLQSEIRAEQRPNRQEHQAKDQHPTKSGVKHIAKGNEVEKHSSAVKHSDTAKQAASESELQQPELNEEMQHAAASVAVAQKLLNADAEKAEALINKAVATGKVDDKRVAAYAVHEAQRLSASLYDAKKNLASAKYKMAHLPVSAKARAAESARKKEKEKKEAAQKRALVAEQEAYAKQYGVTTSCARHCGNEKICESTRCEEKHRTGCVQYSGKQCVPVQKCTARSKRCAKVTACLKKGPKQCEYVRECVKEANVCETKNVCVKRAKDCKTTYSKACISCAEKVEACQSARTVAAQCGGKCEAKCAEDKKCLAQCNDGCSKSYHGFLHACTTECPACDEARGCKCLKREPKRRCGKQCKQWRKTSKQVCTASCLSKGHTSTCNDSFCSQYTTGTEKKCSSLCIKTGKLAAGKDCRCTKWSKLKQEKCKDKCSHKKCVPECAPTFHSKCVQRAPMRCHHPRKCAVPLAKKCIKKRGCAKRGEQVCKHKTKCLADENRCTPVSVCARRETKCADEYTKECIACASKSEACRGARKNSEKCLGDCDKNCNGNKECMRSCQRGCDTIQRGLLTSCHDKCPSCVKKVSVCESVCAESMVRNQCKKVCIKEKKLPQKFCYRPCVKVGQYEHCDEHFCSKYTYGEHVCDKPCVRHEAYTTKWCKPKCSDVQCKKLCEFKPQKTCARFEKECKTSRCVHRGVKCKKTKVCVIPGRQKCVHPKKCIQHKKKCAKKTHCVKKVTKCSADKSSCDSCRRKAAACSDPGAGSCIASCKLKCGSDQACFVHCQSGCRSISSGFKAACAVACPMCGAPLQDCKQVCAKTKVENKCTKVCTKHVPVGKPECKQEPCRMMGHSRKCDANACLKHVRTKETCRNRCAEYTSKLQKVCETDCSKDPADTLDQYKKGLGRHEAKEQRLSKCQHECYEAKVTCPSNKLTACTQQFQHDVEKCISSCATSTDVVADTYGKCMGKCAAEHPLEGINKCQHNKCANLEGHDLKVCEKQCYQARGMCRCGCDARKEYVCHGYKCECRDQIKNDAALEAAKAVAGAASNTADVYVTNKRASSESGAQSVAEAAVKAAAKYGVKGNTALLHSADTAKAAAEEEKAVKQAQKQKAALQHLMRKGADALALKTAKNTTMHDAATQRTETLLAATAGAKESSADMVEDMVKLVAVAASKTARAKALAAADGEDHVHTDVTAAAKAAVRAVMKPIMQMIATVAKDATEAALSKFPPKTALTLSEKAKADIHKTAATAAETEAKKMVTKQDKAALLSHVEKEATDATQPTVMGYVKELASKAALQSRSRSEQQHMAEAQVMGVAKVSAGHVAQKALDDSKKIIHRATKDAVEAAITDAASQRMSDKGVTTEKAIATDVKQAMDHAARHGEKAAKAAAKQAIMKEVQRASSAARKEAAAKGKTIKSQAHAANKAATEAMKKGRRVQKVVKGITKREVSKVKVKVRQSQPVARQTKVAAVNPPSRTEGGSMLQESALDSHSHAPEQHRTSKEPPKAAPTPGTLVLEAIEQMHGKKKMVSHLENRLQRAAQAAAENAAHKVAKQGSAKAKAAARQAAKLAAKSAVLSEVRAAATIAAQRAKEALKYRDVESQASAASAAASQAAQHVLAIAKRIVHKVAKTAADKVLKHHQEEDDRHVSKDHS